MISIEHASEQKLRGGFYTEADIAAFLTSWALAGKPRRVLEPSCGDGAFLKAIARLTPEALEAVVGLELDPAEAAKARAKATTIKALTKVVTGDFLEWFLSRVPVREFDAVVGNPPFIRYQFLDGRQQRLAERIFDLHNMPFTKHTNAWVPFVVASLALLRPGGRLAMVVPTELLHVLHAAPLRHFILAQCSRVMVVDPVDIWFSGTLQGVVLLLAEKRQGCQDGPTMLAIQPIADRKELARPAAEQFTRADFFPASVLNGKWMVGLLTASERRLLDQIKALSAVRRFADIATVDVGIVTGANDFFLVSDETVDRYELHRWARPMFGRSEHVRGVIYDQRGHEENKRRGLPANFLAFGTIPLDDLSDGARRYIREGVAQGLPERYKCRIRTPWYGVPSVYLAPVGMLKRSHHFPRLVLNTAKAYTTDTAYRIRTKRVRAADLVGSFVNSLTALSAELEGRHYGGGVLELVPSEIEKLLVPVVRLPRGSLQYLDRAVRAATPPEDLLAERDHDVLEPAGIARREREELLGAWLRLRNRRQRTNSVEAPAQS